MNDEQRKLIAEAFEAAIETLSNTSINAAAKKIAKVPEGEDDASGFFKPLLKKNMTVKFDPAKREGSIGNLFHDIGFALSSNDNAVYLWLGDNKMTTKVSGYDRAAKAVLDLHAVMDKIARM